MFNAQNSDTWYFDKNLNYPKQICDWRTSWQNFDSYYSGCDDSLQKSSWECHNAARYGILDKAIRTPGKLWCGFEYAKLYNSDSYVIEIFPTFCDRGEW